MWTRIPKLDSNWWLRLSSVYIHKSIERRLTLTVIRSHKVTTLGRRLTLWTNDIHWQSCESEKMWLTLGRQICPLHHHSASLLQIMNSFPFFSVGTGNIGSWTFGYACHFKTRWSVPCTEQGSQHISRTSQDPMKTFPGPFRSPQMSKCEK